MKRSGWEVILGLLVIAAIVIPVSVSIARNREAAKLDTYYPLRAEFNKLGGVKPGMDVRLAGIRIGYVGGLTLDQENVLAVLDLRIDTEYQLPVDTKVSVKSTGAFGAYYVNLEPGPSTDRMKSGDLFTNVQDVSSLEDEIAAVAFGTD